MIPAYSFSLPAPDPIAALPTEAELLAIDRCYALAAAMGLLERLLILRALQQQLNEEHLL